MRKARTAEGTAGNSSSDWHRLLEAEQRLEAEMVAAKVAADARVEAARRALAAAVPDPAALERCARAEADADATRHAHELTTLEESSERQVRRLTTASDRLVDDLARWVMTTVLVDAARARAR